MQVDIPQLAEGDTATPIAIRGYMSQLCTGWSQKIKAFSSLVIPGVTSPAQGL